MVRLLRSDPPNNPRIEAVLPNAALPGGEIEIQGANLGTTGLHRPLSAIGGATAPVLLTRSNRLIVRVPEATQQSTRLESLPQRQP